MALKGIGFPLSPAPSPVPSVRQLRIHSPRWECNDVGKEQAIVDLFGSLHAGAKISVLRQLLDQCPREALIYAQEIISPRLKRDPFKFLPLEVSLRILSHIREPKSLAAAAQVSRLWYFLLSDDSTWKQLCRDHHYRRLSAAGSYVHQWNRFRERACSQANEETSEPGNLEDCSIFDEPTSPEYSQDFPNLPPIADLQQPSQQPSHYSEQSSDFQSNSHFRRPVTSASTHSQADFSSHDDQSLQSERSQGEFEPRSAPTNQRELDQQSERSPGDLTLPRNRDPRRSSLLRPVPDSSLLAESGEPIMQYGSRLPNFDLAMHQHLAQTLDFAGDPIGEAFYDPEACVNRPPDSYRSHFRQQYLLNQAWEEGGRLAGRYSLPDHAGAIVTVVLMQDSYVVVALDTSLILVFSEDGKLQRSLYGHVMGVWALELRGHTLLSGGCDRDVREWDLSSGACRKILRGHSSTVRCLAITDSTTALSGGRDGLIRVWDLENGRSVHRLMGHTGSVRRLEVANLEGRDLVVSASYDCTAKVWDVRSGQLLHTLSGHSNQIYSLAVNGGRIATGSLDHAICIWDLRTGVRLATLLGHSALVGQLCLRDTTLVSGGSDGAVRLWDLTSMTCTRRIAAHDNSVTCLRLAGERIITGGPDCFVQLWNIRTGENIRQLYKPSVSTVWGIAAKEDRLLTVYSEGPDIVIELMSFAPP